MAAVNTQIVAREVAQLMKRKNFASENPGVMYVLAPQWL